MKQKNDYYRRLEESRINEIKKDYSKKGYEVIIQPTPNDLPAFLKNYRPDMIAKSDNETVIIEVKSERSLKKSKYLEQLAKQLKEYGKNWRLELIVTNPRKREYSGYNELSDKDIKKRLDEVNNLKELNYLESAFLLAWSTLIAAIRNKLDKEEKNIYNKNTTALVKNLYSFGFINKSNYNKLIKANVIRNCLMHGKKTTEKDLHLVEDVVDILIEHFIN